MLVRKFHSMEKSLFNTLTFALGNCMKGYDEHFFHKRKLYDKHFLSTRVMNWL